MRKAVKITTIVICSALIVLALIGGVFAELGIIQFEQTKKPSFVNDAWRETEEYAIYSALLMQIVVALDIILFSSALLICVLYWERLNDAVEHPKFFLSKIMTKTTLKIQLPVEILGIIVCVAVFLILQFVSISVDWIALFAIFILISSIASCVLLLITIVALIWQIKDANKNIEKYQRVM